MVKPKSCSFCGRLQQDAKQLLTGPTIFICDRCVYNLSAQLHGKDTEQEVRLRDELEKAVTESFKKVTANLNLGPLNDKYQRLVKVSYKEGPESPTFPEVFAEFKRGVEEEIPQGDYQTRYDLGIAYSEMGLKEDAFRELSQSLRFALLDGDMDKAAEIMSALLVVHLDSARVIKAMQNIFREMPS